MSVISSCQILVILLCFVYVSETFLSSTLDSACPAFSWIIIFIFQMRTEVRNIKCIHKVMYFPLCDLVLNSLDSGSAPGEIRTYDVIYETIQYMYCR